MMLSDWCVCPMCSFPALLSQFTKLVTKVNENIIHNYVIKNCSNIFKKITSIHYQKCGHVLYVLLKCFEWIFMFIH